ncbi:MAG: hypothetical protein ACJ8HJ_00365 [Massilia sp.]
MKRAEIMAVAGRRGFLARALAAGALVQALPPYGRAAAAPVPSTIVSLAEFGGRPGAGRAALAGAFRRALATLSRAGGGTLLVPPGAYDFGTVDAPLVILPCRDLRDIAISAYGAVFIANTAAPVMPNMFYFFNFDNVTLAGATFMDQGFSPWIDWRGMYCVGIQADRPSGNLRLVDCRAERVLGLLASNNGPAGRHLMSDIHVQGTVRHAYYGVGANHVGGRVSVDLACHNVRRAYIAYAARHADVAVRASADAAWPGSNGFVALVCAGARLGDVEDVRVRVDVAGHCIHGSYVHFYHQGPERDGAMRNVDATVNVAGMDTLACMFLFDHETHGVQPRTARRWDRIGLHGSLPAGCAGRVVANPSVSASPGAVWLDRNLARPRDVLPAGFRVAPSLSASAPCDC